MKKLKSRKGITTARRGGALPFSKRQIVVSLFLVSAIGTAHADPITIGNGQTKYQDDSTLQQGGNAKPSDIKFEGTVPTEGNSVTAIFQVTGDYAFTGIGGPDTSLNLAEGNAGAIQVVSGTLTFSDATNRAIYMSAGSRLDLIADKGAQFFFDNNKYTGNEGGAIYVDWAGVLNITNASFIDNSATQFGGAIFARPSSNTSTISNAIFKKNSAGKEGGAIYAEGDETPFIISHTLFKKNSAKEGGAIYDNGATTVIDSVFIGNSATQYGGAFRSWNGTLTDVDFFYNTTNGSGAAIYVPGSLTLKISAGKTSTFSGNLENVGSTPSANSIFFNDAEYAILEFGHLFEIDIADGGTLDMRDPMRSYSNYSEFIEQTLTITKTGAGLWKLGGRNDLDQDVSTPKFEFKEGELYLYAQGEVNNANKYDLTAKVDAAVLNLGPGTFTLGDGTKRAILTVSGDNAINVSDAGQITFADNALIQAGNYQKETRLTLGSDTNPALGGKVTFRVAAPDAKLTIVGKLGGSGNLVKDGLGTLGLNAVNKYTGSTTVSAGKLILGAQKAIAASHEVIVKNDAILQLLPDDNGPGQTQTLQSLTHSGIVDFGLGNLNNTLLIEGDLNGKGGTFRLDTQMNGDGSPTNKIVIKGNVYGYSLLQVTLPPDSTFANTDRETQVIQWVGNGDNIVEQGRNAFTLVNKGVIGAYQYALDYQAGNGWFLVNTPLYSPSAVNTVAAQAANAEQGFLQLANLHQRVGEYRNLRPELQTWAKTYYFQLKNDGKRQFGFDQKTTGIQVGHEFLAETTESGGSVRAALAIDYASSRTDFEDRERHRFPSFGLSSDTGKMEASNTALGGYVTRTAENGAYVDLVGQVAWLRNRFRDIYGDTATQKGWLAGISAEGGIPLWTAGTEKEWLLEGQAQLIYQYAKYGSFRNSLSRFEKYNADSLRGRLGLRLTRSLKTTQDKPLQVYGLFNVVHDFLDPEALRIGDNGGNYVQVKESYNKSYGELGFGVYGHVSKLTTLFGDLRYQQSFSNGSGKREGSSVNLGVRFEF